VVARRGVRLAPHPGVTPRKMLSIMLGHASVAITLDRYGHLYPGDVHLYVDRLGEAALAAPAD
jgi:hypothetical protein